MARREEAGHCEGKTSFFLEGDNAIVTRQDIMCCKNETTWSDPEHHEPKRIELNTIMVNPPNQIIDDQDDT